MAGAWSKQGGNWWGGGGYGGWHQGGYRTGGGGGNSNGGGGRMWDCLCCADALKEGQGRGPWRNPMSVNCCLACGKTWAEGAAQAEKAANEKSGGAASKGGGTALEKAKEAVKLAAKKANGGQEEEKAAMEELVEESTEVTRPPPAGGYGNFDDEEDLQDEVLLVDLVMPQEFQVIVPLLKYPRALEHADDWDPVKAAKRFLPGKAGGVGIAQLKEDLQGQEDLLKLCLKKLPGTESLKEGPLRKSIEAVKKAITKNDDKEVTLAELQVCELDLALKKANLAEEERTSRADAGEVKADKRADRAEAIIQEQIDALLVKRSILAQDKLKRANAWDNRRALLASRHEALTELIAEKREEAAAKTGAPSTTGAPMNVDLTQEDAKKELAQYKTQAEAEVAKIRQTAAEAQTVAVAEAAAGVADLKEQIAALQKGLTALQTSQSSQGQPSTEARLTDEIQKHHSRTVMYVEADLPKLETVPDKKGKLIMTVLRTNLVRWAQIGWCPITFLQLISGTEEEDTPAAMTMVKEVAGHTLWERFYAATEVQTTDYVPLQMGTILTTSLQNADHMMKKWADLRGHQVGDKATERFNELREANETAKKSRTGPYQA